MKTINNYIIIIMCILLSACTGGKQNSFSQIDGGDTLKLKYAKNLCIVKFEEYTEVTLSDPWNKDKTLAKYVLVDVTDEDFDEEDIEDIEDDVDDDAVIVKTPLKKALVSTSVHCNLYDMFGKKEMIAGVCDAEYMGIDFVKKGLADKKIADCGSSMQPNLERVIALSPDAIMLSPYQGSSYGKVAEIGVPIIQLSDYMETSPLGRAEWMIFFGMLVGEEDKAIAEFEKIEKEYNRYKELAAKETSRKSVMMDKMVQATWYVPGGESTIGQMLRDANCNYAYADTKQSGSVEQSFEQVLQKFADADIWLMRYSDGGVANYNLASLEKENDKYKAFNAFKQGEVYGCETTKVPFFEETPFHPEYLLHDFIILLHPDAEFSKGKTPRYFKKL